MIKLELEFEDLQSIDYALMMFESECQTRINMCNFTGNFDAMHHHEKQLEHTQKALKAIRDQL